MNTTTFKYTRSIRIPYRGCYFDSLLELKYALSIENDCRFLREPVIIGYDPKTFRTTNYFREETKMYTPDFLVRPKNTSDVFLVEVKPAAFRNSGQLKKYIAVGNDYIAQHHLPWQYKIVFEDDIILPEEELKKYQLFLRKRKSFEPIFSLKQLDRRYNADCIKYFSSVPHFPEDELGRTDYARYVRRAI